VASFCWAAAYFPGANNGLTLPQSGRQELCGKRIAIIFNYVGCGTRNPHTGARDLSPKNAGAGWGTGGTGDGSGVGSGWGGSGSGWGMGLGRTSGPPAVDIGSSDMNSP
jgi:hypothetical protein